MEDGSNLKRPRGRPKKVEPVDKMDFLTIPQVIQYLREKGRPVSRQKLRDQIVIGRLKAYIDELTHDNQGHPILRIKRSDLDTWLISTLKLIIPKPLP